MEAKREVHVDEYRFQRRLDIAHNILNLSTELYSLGCLWASVPCHKCPLFSQNGGSAIGRIQSASEKMVRLVQEVGIDIKDTPTETYGYKKYNLKVKEEDY